MKLISASGKSTCHEEARRPPEEYFTRAKEKLGCLNFISARSLAGGGKFGWVGGVESCGQVNGEEQESGGDSRMHRASGFVLSRARGMGVGNRVGSDALVIE